MHVAAVVGAFLVMSAAPSSAAPTALQNGSFDTSLAGWTLNADPAWSIAWNPTGNTASGGSAKVRWIGPAAPQWAYMHTMTQDGIAVTPGATYEFRAALRLEHDPVDPRKPCPAAGSSPGAIHVWMYGDNPRSPLLGTTKVDEFYGCGWADLKGYVVAPPEAKTLALRLFMPGSGEYTAQFDDVSVRALPTDAEFLAGMAKYVVSSDPNVHLDRGGPSTTVSAVDGAVLNWATSSAQAVSITPGIGSVAVSGSHVVHPAQTTTYTLTASGPFGSVVKQVIVNVTP